MHLIALFLYDFFSLWLDICFQLFDILVIRNDRLKPIISRMIGFIVEGITDVLYFVHKEMSFVTHIINECNG